MLPNVLAPGREEDYAAQADPRAVINAGDARFTVLTPYMIRLEWSLDRVFEDRPTVMAVNRRLPVPEFTVEHDGALLTIRTAALSLRYDASRGRFAEDNLEIVAELPGHPVEWRPGLVDELNLGGTYRTLDGISGEIDLPPGALSRSGWTLIDDTLRLVLDGESDWPWISERRPGEAVDWYFLAYGNDYLRGLQDYLAISGRVPLPPRYVFGGWWSRYWAYSDAELRELVGEFQQHGVPLDVLVIDMDWHLEGWTGYTWNPRFFPDPEGFLTWVHEQGLRTTLNLHPAEGVGRHEAAFAAMARALGHDPDKAQRIPFNCTDRKYIDAYFQCLHHPLERQGVDFWWMDWQQGTETSIKGLDPLWWLNYLHWTDWQRDPRSTHERPLIFSRWGGFGNHRYPIGFSGDTYSDWPSLGFQPHFTATAGNVGYAYWSHDIGGHQPGPVEPELYARWVQWGALSPVLRTHTTQNPTAERRIWAYPQPYYDVMKAAWLLRYQLIPYIYTQSRKTYDTGMPLCRPLYYAWPGFDEAYACPDEYLFGDDLLVAPVCEPVNRWNGCASLSVWLGPGRWTYWFTGRTYEGPGWVRIIAPIEHIPIFVRHGAIIPGMRVARNTGEGAADPLELHIFGGTRGDTRVYEDDGLSRGYQRGAQRFTPVQFERKGAICAVVIGPAEGEYDGAPAERGYEIWLHDSLPPRAVQVGEQALDPAAAPGEVGWWYDEERLATVVRTPPLAAGAGATVSIRLHSQAEVEQALASGLRGQLDVLRKAAATASDALPAELAELLRIPADLSANLEQAAAAVARLRDDALALADQLAHLDIPREQQTEFMTRLLGLFARLNIVPTDESDFTVDAYARVSLDPPLGPLVNARTELHFAPPNYWRTLRMRQEQSTDASGAALATTAVRVATEESLQTTVLQATVKVTGGRQQIVVPLERTLLPSINAWWVIGPFDAPFPKGLDMVFPPEEGIDLAATYVGKNKRKVKWQAVHRVLHSGHDAAAEYFVNLSEIYGHRTFHAVAYALTYLHVPEAMPAKLLVGSDDQLIAWLNGQEVHRTPYGRPYASKQDRVPVQLQAGVNELLLKITQGDGEWGFGGHIETRDGQALPQVRVSLSPEEILIAKRPRRGKARRS